MGRVTTLPRSRALTVEDLDLMPDDGHRYELIDGTLVVTPAPSDPHQASVGELYVLLRAACPSDLRVRLAPYDVTLAADTLVQPDVLVATKAAITHRGLPAAPVLAVEVLSPSTALIDLNLKRARYEQAGVASYWAFDPVGLRLRAWDLAGGEYVEVADVSGEDSWTSELPYAVTVIPSQLVD
jgi:Uma2 family endonuclease